MISGKDIIAKAMTQVGDQYIFGYEVNLDDPNPKAFDCSELLQWVCHQLHVKPEMPDGAINQYHHCNNHDDLIEIEDGITTKGALLFRISDKGNHVAISRGDGTTIEARGKKYGVGIWLAENRPWTDAGLIPGVEYEGWEDT